MTDQLDPDYQGIKRNMLPIASLTIDSLIRIQGIGDLYQIYALCQRGGNDFNLAYIPSDFPDEPSEGFDPAYMVKLYEHGYQMSLAGYPWKKGGAGFYPGALRLRPVSYGSQLRRIRDYSSGSTHVTRPLNCLMASTLSGACSEQSAC